MASNINEQLLTVDDLAAKLQLAKQTIYNRVSANEIPHVKIGRSLRFRPSEIERWIIEQTAEAERKADAREAA